LLLELQGHKDNQDNGVFGAVFIKQRRGACRFCTVPQYIGSLNSRAVRTAPTKKLYNPHSNKASHGKPTAWMTLVCSQKDGRQQSSSSS
jgi:hypothetical protein